MAIFSQAKPAGTPTWVDLITPNADIARAFYNAVFGWEYDISGPEYGNYTIARVGQHSVAGLSEPPPGDTPMPSGWGLYFASDGLEADVARAAELGATVLIPPSSAGEFGQWATLKDPTGAAFNFWQAGRHVGTELTEDAGSVAWFELYSPNAKQARDFYAALLGATADAMPGGMEYYVLNHGTQQLAGIMQIDPSWGDFQPQWITYFSVVDIDDTVARVAKHGGKVMGPIDDSPFGRLAALADPAGAHLKVIEPPKS